MLPTNRPGICQRRQSIDQGPCFGQGAPDAAGLFGRDLGTPPKMNGELSTLPLLSVGGWRRRQEPRRG